MIQAARLLLVTLCLAAWTGTALAAAGPAVAALDAASKDAQVVVVVPQLGDASRKLAGWLSAAGIPANPQLQDLLGNTKREMGVEAGLNDNGPLVLVVRNLAAMQQEGGRADIVLLVSVSDYAAFTKNFGGAAEGVSEIKLKDGSTGFAKKAGNFAAIARDRAVLEAYEPANAGGTLVSNLGPGGATALDRCDVAVYVDCAAAGPQFSELVKAGMHAAGQHASAMDAPSLPGAEALSQMHGAMLDYVVANSTAMVVGFDITDAGLGVSKVIRMKKGSELAGYFPGGKSAAAAELSRLPKQPYMMSVALDGKAVAFDKLIERWQQPGQPGTEEMKALGKGVKSFAAVFYAPSQGSMMAGLANTLTVITTDDGETYLKQLQAYMQAINGQKKPLDPAQPDGPGVAYTASYTAGALNLGGVSVDQFLVQQQIPPEMLARLGPAASFATMFANTRGYAAAKGQHVVISTSPDPQMITTALKSVEAGDGLGADAAITDGRKNNLPSNPAMEMYLDLGGVAAFANPMLTMFGMPPIQPPADLPPIAVGMSVDGDTLLGRAYLPTAGVRLIVDTFSGVQQMMAPMGPGAPRTRPGGPAPY